eukprot:7217286-Prymnesium_polylepis.1
MASMRLAKPRLSAAFDAWSDDWERSERQRHAAARKAREAGLVAREAALQESHASLEGRVLELSGALELSKYEARASAEAAAAMQQRVEEAMQGWMAAVRRPTARAREDENAACKRRLPCLPRPRRPARPAAGARAASGLDQGGRGGGGRAASGRCADGRRGGCARRVGGAWPDLLRRREPRVPTSPPYGMLGGDHVSTAGPPAPPLPRAVRLGASPNPGRGANPVDSPPL